MGGNVSFNGVAADRLDLTKIDRKDLVRSLTVSLGLLNQAFKKAHKKDLWAHDISEYLSGSTTNLFNLNISDEDFVKVKPTVGDIDTQVDGNDQADIESFLKATVDKKFGDLRLVNYKNSVGTLVSLWTHERFGVNIQVDFELVSFVGGKPHPWSRFAFSSDWKDMTLGIKGIAHKYIFRAITAIHQKDVLVRMKTKDKPISSSHLAFSPKGLRQKLEPVIKDGSHEHVGDVPVYRELDTSETGFETDIKKVFIGLFGKKPAASDLQKMNSYIGAIELVKKYIAKADHIKVADGMANLLWGTGSGGQKMYVSDALRDKAEKLLIMNYMIDQLGLPEKRWDSLVDGYYLRY